MPAPGLRQNVGMRFLFGFGALVFAYMAITPLSLVGAQLDSACAAEACESGPVVRVILVAAYAITALTLVATSFAFAHHAVREQERTRERVVRGLGASAVAVAGALFALMAVTYPVAAAIGAGLAGACYATLAWLKRRGAEPDPATNGHHPEIRGISGR